MVRFSPENAPEKMPAPSSEDLGTASSPNLPNPPTQPTPDSDTTQSISAPSVALLPRRSSAPALSQPEPNLVSPLKLERMPTFEEYLSALAPGAPDPMALDSVMDALLQQDLIGGAADGSGGLSELVAQMWRDEDPAIKEAYLRREEARRRVGEEEVVEGHGNPLPATLVHPISADERWDLTPTDVVVSNAQPSARSHTPENGNSDERKV
ncbi:hypothetical protein BDK51DRAFT_29337 [Blyttiomyces helicus]|uniref:Uncharacterized protein n=1 Tax=Blyttiomyces helicus TaxID=388810 RepID=A0A4P9WK85_9FUNG|nr:hypothetical protein BDK51DRAFT_29337 [Blyttiomyces helicus]|eukprot:RKO93389.1 hypothetical protein BDK51DRAFT_29337 [Blyttiomyces helicus]